MDVAANFIGSLPGCRIMRRNDDGITGFIWRRITGWIRELSPSDLIIEVAHWRLDESSLEPVAIEVGKSAADATRRLLELTFMFDCLRTELERDVPISSWLPLSKRHFDSVTFVGSRLPNLMDLCELPLRATACLIGRSVQRASRMVFQDSSSELKHGFNLIQKFCAGGVIDRHSVASAFEFCYQNQAGEGTVTTSIECQQLEIAEAGLFEVLERAADFEEESSCVSFYDFVTWCTQMLRFATFTHRSDSIEKSQNLISWTAKDYDLLRNMRLGNAAEMGKAIVVEDLPTLPNVIN